MFLFLRKINSFLLVILIGIFYYYYSIDQGRVDWTVYSNEIDIQEFLNARFQNTEIIYNEYNVNLDHSTYTAYFLSDGFSGPAPDKENIKYTLPINIETSIVKATLRTPPSPMITTLNLDVPRTSERILGCYIKEAEANSECLRNVSILSLQNVVANDLTFENTNVQSNTNSSTNDNAVNTNPLISFLDTVLAPIVNLAETFTNNSNIDIFGVRTVTNVGQVVKDISTVGSNFLWGHDDIQQFVPVEGKSGGKRAVLPVTIEVQGYGGQSNENAFVNSFGNLTLESTKIFRLPNMGIGRGNTDVKGKTLSTFAIYDPFTTIVDPNQQVEQGATAKVVNFVYNLFANIVQTNQLLPTNYSRFGIPNPIRSITNAKEINYAYSLDKIVRFANPAPSPLPNPFPPPDDSCRNQYLQELENNGCNLGTNQLSDVCRSIENDIARCEQNNNKYYFGYDRLPNSTKQTFAIIKEFVSEEQLKICIQSYINRQGCDLLSVEEGNNVIGYQNKSIPVGSTLASQQNLRDLWNNKSFNDPWINYLSPSWCSEYTEFGRIKATGDSASGVYRVELLDTERKKLYADAQNIQELLNEDNDTSTTNQGTRNVKGTRGNVLAVDFMLTHCVIAGGLQNYVVSQALNYANYSTDSELTGKWNVPRAGLTCDKKEVAIHGKPIKTNVPTKDAIPYTLIGDLDRAKSRGHALGIQYDNNYWDLTAIFSKDYGELGLRYPDYNVYEYAGQDMVLVLDSLGKPRYIVGNLNRPGSDGTTGEVKPFICYIPSQEQLALMTYLIQRFSSSDVLCKVLFENSEKFSLVQFASYRRHIVDINGDNKMENLDVVNIISTGDNVRVFQVVIPVMSDLGLNFPVVSKSDVTYTDILNSPATQAWDFVQNDDVVYGVSRSTSNVIEIYRISNIYDGSPNNLRLNVNEISSNNCFGVSVCGSQYVFLKIVPTPTTFYVILTYSGEKEDANSFNEGYLIEVPYFVFESNNYGDIRVTIFPIPQVNGFNGRISKINISNITWFGVRTLDIFLEPSGSLVRVILSQIPIEGSITANSYPALIYHWRYAAYTTDCTNYLGLYEFNNCGFPPMDPINTPTIFDFTYDGGRIVGSYIHKYDIHGMTFYSPDILYGMTPLYMKIENKGSTEIYSNLFAISGLNGTDPIVNPVKSKNIPSSSKEYIPNDSSSPLFKRFGFVVYDNPMYYPAKWNCMVKLNKIITGEDPLMRLFGKEVEINLLPFNLEDMTVDVSTTGDEYSSENDGSYCETTWCISNDTPFVDEKFGNNSRIATVNNTDVNQEIEERIVAAVLRRKGEDNINLIRSRVRYMCQKAAEYNVSCAFIAAIWFQESTFSLSESGIFGCFLDGADSWQEQINCAVVSVRNRFNEYQQYSEGGRKEFDIPFKGQDGGTCKVSNAFVYTMERYTPIDSKRKGDPRNDCNRGLVRRVPNSLSDSDYYSNMTRYPITFADVKLFDPNPRIFDPRTELFCVGDKVNSKYNPGYFRNGEKPDWSNSKLMAAWPNIESMLKEINDPRLQLTKNCFARNPSYSNSSQNINQIENDYQAVEGTMFEYKMSLYNTGTASAAQYLMLVNQWDKATGRKDAGPLVGTHVISPGGDFSVLRRMGYFNATHLSHLYRPGSDQGIIITGVEVPWDKGRVFPDPSKPADGSNPGGGMCEIATALAYTVSKVGTPSDESNIQMKPSSGRINNRSGFVGSVNFITHSYNLGMVQKYNSLVLKHGSQPMADNTTDTEFPRTKFVSFLSPTNDLLIKNPSTKYYLIIRIDFDEKANIVSFKAYFAKKK